jgi:hypothetical protein
MLWLLLLLLLSALGVLWWRFAMPPPPPAAHLPAPLSGNHPCLRTRHYRLADFQPRPGGEGEPPVPSLAEEAGAAPPAEMAAAESTAEPAADPAADPRAERPSEPGRLPEGARHNYLTDPAPTPGDEHNRGVELSAAERRARMRALMSQAVENRRAAPATA